MVTKKEILNMSKLAMISVNEDEALKFTCGINDILAFVDMIYEVEHGNEEFHDLNNLKNCLREDKVKISMTNKEILSGTNYYNNEGYFIVKKGV